VYKAASRISASERSVRGHAVGDDREAGGVAAFNFKSGAGGKRRKHFVDLRLGLQQGKRHVLTPFEVDVDFATPPAGGGAHNANTGYGADRLFQRKSHFNGRALGGPVTGIGVEGSVRGIDSSGAVPVLSGVWLTRLTG